MTCLNKLRHSPLCPPQTMQRLETALAAALAKIEQLEEERAELEAERAKDKRIIEQLKAERPIELPGDVFRLIMAMRAFKIRERRGIYHPPVETGLGLRKLYPMVGRMPEWTPKMERFYALWMSCSPESKTQGGRKFGGSVSRR